MNSLLKLGRFPVLLARRDKFASPLRLDLIAPLSSGHEPTRQISDSNKLIYTGKLTNRIYYLKTLSIVSSIGLASAYGYTVSVKGFTTALAGIGFAFMPFMMSPFIIAWFFKRYVISLYYDSKHDLYTLHHYGLLLNKRRCTFKSQDVIRSEVTSMLNTFTVNNKPFFLHDEDLIDAESIQVYKKMVGLDKEKPK